GQARQPIEACHAGPEPGAARRCQHDFPQSPQPGLPRIGQPGSGHLSRPDRLHLRVRTGLMLRIKPRIDAGRAALLITAALAAALGGCQSEPTTAVLAANDYRLRHPIVLAERNETLDLPVG